MSSVPRALLAALLVVGLGSVLSAQIVINEIRIDEPGTDVDEYFELAGPPGASLDGLTYIVIGDSPGSGAIEAVIDLTGFTIPASGYFVAAESTFTFGVPDLVTDLVFENSDNVTHILVEGFTGASGDDLDVDDDGVLDSTPWTAIVDLIAVIEEENPPSGTEYHYGPPSVGPDVSTAGSFVPSHVRRCPDSTGDFLTGAYGTAGGDDSPGSTNSCPACLLPFDLSCASDCGAGAIDLSWVNSEDYTEINIIRNGTTIATLPAVVAGTTSTYTDPAPGSAGVYTYVVNAVCASGAVGDVECSLIHSPYGGERHMVFAGEEATGLVDSVSAVYEALLDAGESAILIDTLSVDCVSTFASPGRVLWLLNGTNSDEHELTFDEGQLVVDLLSAGVHVYVESNDMWTFHPATPLLDYDGVDNAISMPGTMGNPADGDDSFTAMTGLSFAGLDLSSFMAITYTQDQTGNDYTDQLAATATDLGGPSAGPIWQNFPDALPDPAAVETAYVTGIFHDTEAPYGKMISQSWELGGFGDDVFDLIQIYLEVFPAGPTTGGPQFVRGDVNEDGGYDISDAVFALGALFVPGAPSPGCADSADSNDDGTFDISDAVFTLAALFVPGAPGPGAPAGICGEDPTADGLDCVSFAPCP